MKLSWVQTGIDALDFLLDNNHVDLILMDVNMPKMDGYEALQQIKLIKPGIPIMIQTGNSLSEEKEKCHKYGADDFIQKPIRSNELIQKIGKLLLKKMEL